MPLFRTEQMTQFTEEQLRYCWFSEVTASRRTSSSIRSAAPYPLAKTKGNAIARSTAATGVTRSQAIFTKNRRVWAALPKQFKGHCNARRWPHYVIARTTKRLLKLHG